MLKLYGPVLGIVAGVTLLQLANTIFAVLLPLELVAAGFSGTTAGLAKPALVDHIIVQAQKRVERDRKMFDY